MQSGTSGSNSETNLPRNTRRHADNVIAEALKSMNRNDMWRFYAMVYDKKVVPVPCPGREISYRWYEFKQWLQFRLVEVPGRTAVMLGITKNLNINTQIITSNT